jgi:DNA-binding transcriptional LysR family regulator
LRHRSIDLAPFYEFLSAFIKKYHRIRVDLFITNLFVDPIADNIDVAIRFGELRDSTIIAKRIGRNVRYLVASADYLKGPTPPAKPEDLSFSP